MKKENKTGKIKGTEKNLKSIYIEHRKKEKMWGMNSDEMLIPHLKVTFCPPIPPLYVGGYSWNITVSFWKVQKFKSQNLLHLKKKTFTKLYEDASFHTQKTYKHFHDILRLFDGLLNFPFSKNEMMRDYYLWTWYIRVSSRVAEWLKT